jgi:hypothetical protein
LKGGKVVKVGNVGKEYREGLIMLVMESSPVKDIFLTSGVVKNVF